MKRFSSTLIGVFVIGAVVLATVGVISFGAQAWWRDRHFVAVYFDESVHGLERGSAVRLMGVRVGRVSSIDIAYPTGRKTIVQVVCEIDRSPTVTGPDGRRLIDIRDRETFERMVADGLQARLDLIGITGMLYVEMDFFEAPPERTLVLEHREFAVVPSVPSALAGLTDNLAAIAHELGEIDFAGIGESARRLLDSANETLEEARVGELFSQLHDTVRGVNELLESPELERALASAGQSFEDVSRLAQRLESQVDPMAEDFAETSEEIRRTLEEVSRTFSAVQDLVGPRMGLGFQLSETLSTIDEAARSVERLADFIERNPQAIMRGRADER